jgi:hypothetical protein
MKRLRHPIRAIREPFGTAGLIIACIALIAGLTGAAYAAGGLNAKQKKEVKKIAKQFAGKPGAPGAAGPAGPKGDTGAAGAKGDKGDKGDTGSQGKQGIPGAPGKDGETGFTETLPSGKTETGVWAVGNQDGSSIVPLSFNIPLEEAPENVFYVDAAGKEVILVEPGVIGHVDPTHCMGSVEEPTAPAGLVCVYAGFENLTEPEVFKGYSPTKAFKNLYTTGATFFVGVKTGDFLIGTWAVTAK